MYHLLVSILNRSVRFNGGQLTKMASKATAELPADTLTVVADGGYYNVSSIRNRKSKSVRRLISAKTIPE